MAQPDREPQIIEPNVSFHINVNTDRETTPDHAKRDGSLFPDGPIVDYVPIESSTGEIDGRVYVISVDTELEAHDLTVKSPAGDFHPIKFEAILYDLTEDHLDETTHSIGVSYGESLYLGIMNYGEVNDGDTYSGYVSRWIDAADGKQIDYAFPQHAVPNVMITVFTERQQLPPSEQ